MKEHPEDDKEAEDDCENIRQVQYPVHDSRGDRHHGKVINYQELYVPIEEMQVTVGKVTEKYQGWYGENHCDISFCKGTFVPAELKCKYHYGTRYPGDGKVFYGEEQAMEFRIRETEFQGVKEDPPCQQGHQNAECPGTPYGTPGPCIICSTSGKDGGEEEDK
jgi:hypothetical protein